MIVLIDQNEQATNPNIVVGLRKIYPEASITQLVAGDVNVTTPRGLLAIERKTPPDLLGSIADGRIFDQAERMLKHAEFASFIIHGSLIYDDSDRVIANGQRREWAGSSIRAALRTIQGAGCFVEIVKANAYARTVQEVIQTVSKESHVHTKKPIITLETLDPRIQWLSMMPGVGPKRAKDWLEWSGDRLCEALHYGSIFPLLDPTSLPRGFGPKTAQSIPDFLQLELGEHLQILQGEQEETDDKAQE